MRKSSGFKEKLYINSRALCVVGDKIDLVKQQKPQNCYASRNITLSAETPEETSSIDLRKTVETGGKRKTFKLNVKEYKNYQACSKQLRQIYETVEVEDFERILRNFYISDEYKKREKARTSDIIAKIKPDEVYDHFYGQHYTHLRNLISKS